MKRLFVFALALAMIGPVYGQQTEPEQESPDTVKVGTMIIIRKKGPHSEIVTDHKDWNISYNRNKTFTTNWFVLDFGFSNVVDNTDYSNTGGFVDPGLGKHDLKFRTGKSVNVNVWIVMQKLNLIRNAVNLKYGLGLELNNYHFDDGIAMQKDYPVIYATTEDFKKAKLAADYITVPLMLNFNFTPNKRQGFGFSGGVSAGYLYSSRFKTKMNNGDKEKIHDDFGLKKFKLSYIGELVFGPVKIYGSYAMDNMWDEGMDMTPFTVGLRFSY